MTIFKIIFGIALCLPFAIFLLTLLRNLTDILNKSKFIK